MPSAAPEAQAPCPSCGYLAAPDDGALNFCPKCGQDLRPGAAAPGAPGPALGQVIADRYRLLALLGEGGMGAVYKAEHVRMGKALAVKILRGDFARDPGAVSRFRAEAQIVSRLSHPHTIAVFDFGEIEEPGGFYLAMEYVPGRDLARVLLEDGRFTEARAADVGQQLLGSLAEAHEAGIVHRDVKPGNVMLMQTRPGEDFVKVLDFGIAKLRDEGTSTTTTSAGAIVGTPTYLAPEQARGDAVDARADLYAVGCVLYELVAGRPPFVAPSPMAVVSAHLHDPPPPLAELAPGVGRRFAEVVHRAIRKRPEERFASADEMRDALLALGETTSRRGLRPAEPASTGALQIARREDFREFDRQVRSLRRSRIVTPLSVLLFLGAAAATVWRWPDVYDLLVARAPSLAARLPAALRPADRFDGREHEPNDSAAQANAVPLAPGADGRPGFGVVVVTGHVGARRSADDGDADVFRIEVPPGPGRRILVASWHAEGGEGIPGLDVTLSLNRERIDGPGRVSAPLVAAVDGGGPGQPEKLAAAVRAGTYYLAIRERHDAGAAPVERPGDAYALELRLAEPAPGEEVEPDDAPEPGTAGEERYPEWRALAEQNPLSEGAPASGATAVDDPDTWAIGVGIGDVPEAVVVVPDPGLALAARLWAPDAVDLSPPRGQDRVRFEPAGDGAAGDLLFLPLPTPPREGAPVLLQVRAAEGAGRYAVVALGPGIASGEEVLARVKALAGADRLPTALELAAGFARHVPKAPARAEVLTLAGALAEAAAPALGPADVARFDRAAHALGAAIFEGDGGTVRYRGAFEARVEGDGRLAEDAALRVVRFAAPCTPEDVAARAEAFAQRFPGSERIFDVERWRARALEAASAAAGNKDPALRTRAITAWEKIANGPAADEAEDALARLRGTATEKTSPAIPVCPDPGAVVTAPGAGAGPAPAPGAGPAATPGPPHP